MPVWKMQCAFGMDSALPRDREIITPHFNDAGAFSDPDSLCEDLADALDGWSDGTQEITVSAYDAEGTAPVFPAGQAVRNPGQYGITGGPREVAVCLSFYSQRNLPRQRGRVYIPYGLIQLVGDVTSVRPNLATRTKVSTLAPIFEDLGGPDVDWVVWSRSDGVARPVTNWWVDDEWDTIRSRGLRPTTRLAGTTSEL